jgi:hypothetical protein
MVLGKFDRPFVVENEPCNTSNRYTHKNATMYSIDFHNILADGNPVFPVFPV